MRTPRAVGAPYGAVAGGEAPQSAPYRTTRNMVRMKQGSLLGTEKIAR
jgi:hypothetical protein